MAVQKPSIPKGTRDFSPQEMVRRNYIFDTIRSVFQIYGYMPIETPSMENLSTLLGKYGEEGDKLLFRILNSGDFISGIEQLDSFSGRSNELSAKICEKGLRYDLTVPFARYVVQHRNEITFPFKRYQIQPVWRADRPQKGRYREFFQCDVDVVGSDSLIYEVELIQMVDDIFNRLGINVIVKVNNRKILAGIAEAIGAPDHLTDITVAIDKLDKIGLEAVNAELAERGISEDSIQKLQPIIMMEGKMKHKFEVVGELLKTSETGRKGIEETMYFLRYLKDLRLKSKFELDLTLARGLNYYTGAIIEIKAADLAFGSICGGGRYDNLTGIFGMPGISGVGISFGADRIYDVMAELKLFPPDQASGSKVLFINFGPEEERLCMPGLAELRAKGISSEIYPEADKLKKQFSYADSYKIPFVIIAGKDELEKGVFSLKNMKTGEQKSLTWSEVIENLEG